SGKSSRDRAPIARDQYARGQCAEGGRPGAHQRAAHSRGRRCAFVGAKLRPAIDGYLRSRSRGCEKYRRLVASDAFTAGKSARRNETDNKRRRLRALFACSRLSNAAGQPAAGFQVSDKSLRAGDQTRPELRSRTCATLGNDEQRLPFLRTN